MKYRSRISGRENAFLIHLHLTREVLLYFSKITLNLKLTKLNKYDNGTGISKEMVG
jgi:hypothetical protein